MKLCPPKPYSARLRKTLCNFDPQILPEIITSRYAQSACFKGSRTSCDVIMSGVLGSLFGREMSRHLQILRTVPSKEMPWIQSQALLVALNAAEMPSSLTCASALLTQFEPLARIHLHTKTSSSAQRPFPSTSLGPTLYIQRRAL